MPVKSAGSHTRLGLYGGARRNYGSHAGKVGGGGNNLFISLVGQGGGLIARGGLSGQRKGLIA